ncbi:cytochrome d ubiquinol oxidase subunit II [Isoalcanivorax beigongshangi]|uniref:Cytochrome d ubiquinol oxidase subunit II n=1 Tax=Isoalcanivorax beigongshangi TaxID=3238810 RepID=A0ABV4AFG7_9GAMM
MGIDLPLMWALIIGFGLLMYAVMDGFDLGVGLLFPWIKGAEQRDRMVNSVAPIWDGNETWLVLGGAGLMAAFPSAYAILLSALYMPLLLMLGGLIWRGVAFEFRFKADASHRPFWDRALIVGSYVATGAQGVAIGAFIQGFEVADGRFVGGPLDVLTPFSVLTGGGLMLAYALLGATWLVMKTEGPLQARMRALAKPLLWGVVAMIVLVSVWTPLLHPTVAQRWFGELNWLWLSPVPLCVVLTTWALWRALARQHESAPFMLTLVLLLLGYLGLIVGLYPYLVPPSLTLRELAAPDSSMGFTLVGALFILPVILTYTAWSYYVFRGKVQSGEGYH